MNLKFPFKNITVNRLWDFRDQDFWYDYFIRFKQRKDEFYEGILREQVEHFLNLLPDFENEILQIVNTSNQATIDFYFSELKENCSWVCTVDRQEILSEFESWNSENYRKFLEQVEKKEEEYFEKEERRKYSHLEKYEEYTYGIPLSSILNRNRPPLPREKITRTNYNFYCIEEQPELIDFTFLDDYINLLNKLTASFSEISTRYIQRFDNGEIKASTENFFDKAIVYVEGQHDIDLIVKAADLLGRQDILHQVELRQRGGFRNLDKIWKFYKEHSLEIAGQKKILLYDCDTEKSDEDFGYVFKRVIPTFEGNIISKGIENLFGNITAQKAIKHKKEFIDFKATKGTKRGVEFYEECNTINSEEKANFCKWMCENGVKEDFQNFEVIFTLIEEILTNANNKK